MNLKKNIAKEKEERFYRRSLKNKKNNKNKLNELK